VNTNHPLSAPDISHITRYISNSKHKINTKHRKLHCIEMMDNEVPT